MWHHATCLVEAKGRRFPAPFAEILPPFYSEWLLAQRPSVMVAARPGRGKPDPDCRRGKDGKGAWLLGGENGPRILAAQMSSGWEKPHVSCNYYGEGVGGGREGAGATF